MTQIGFPHFCAYRIVYAVPFDRTVKEMSKSGYVDVTKKSSSSGGYLYWDDTTFGKLCYSNYKGSTYHKIVFDNGSNTFSQSRNASEDETDMELNMSSTIARMGSGDYIPTITYYVSRADQTVLATVTGPVLNYVEPTQTFNPLPTVKAGSDYVQFANYDDVRYFYQQMHIKY